MGLRDPEGGQCAPSFPEDAMAHASDGGPGSGSSADATDRGPRGPAPHTRRRPRRLRRSRSGRPPPPARPRSPTPRAGRRAAPGPRAPLPPRARLAQCAAQTPPVAPGNHGTPGGAAGGGGAARAAGPVPGEPDAPARSARPQSPGPARPAGMRSPEPSPTPPLLAGARAGARRDELPAARMEPAERKRLPSASLGADPGEETKLKRGISQDSTSSPKLDRYKIARQLTEKAIKEKKIFSICGHYPVIRATLRRKGWVEKKFHILPKVIPNADDDNAGVTEHKHAEGKENQEAALEKTDDIHDVMSRLVKNETPYFLWTIKRDVVDYHSLSGEQMLNHYGKTASFTTKIGLCVNMRNLPWYVQADPDSFFPRCYGLCSESEKQEFLDDFRRTVASSILKWVVSHQSHSGGQPGGRGAACDPGPSDQKASQSAGCRLTGLSGQLVDTACKVCQAYLGQLEHRDIDVPEDAGTSLTEEEWKDLTEQYYSLIHGDAFISSSRNHFSQCQALLSKITSVNPQTEIDGLRNIWIIKPAAKSRGRDIVCMSRVEEILELAAADHLSAKDNKWVVQKYIETPLLIYGTKFDIRQWFLVTDWNPLTIWFYKESYLRFSTQRFSLESLDSAIHLCNNSIQRHLSNDKDRSPLLPQHNMWTSTRFREYLQKRGRGAAWAGVIYPAMKRAVANTMRAAQDRVEPRKNSFELYGADFVLGRDFRPWLIEINSSPTMHASTPVTAQLCAQVQEDTIKVVLDRRADRGCDIGNFELLWRQPAVELPPFHGSDLCVEGVGVRRARKQMPPISSVNAPSSLLDGQPPRVRCPAAATNPPLGAPAAPQPDPGLKEAQAGPAPPWRAARSRKARSATAPSVGRVAFPTCHFRHADSGAPKTGATDAESDRPSDPKIPKEPALPSALPSGKTAEGALLQPPKPPVVFAQRAFVPPMSSDQRQPSWVPLGKAERAPGCGLGSHRLPASPPPGTRGFLGRRPHPAGGMKERASQTSEHREASTHTTSARMALARLRSVGEEGYSATRRRGVNTSGAITKYMTVQFSVPRTRLPPVIKTCSCPLLQKSPDCDIRLQPQTSRLYSALGSTSGLFIC
ncbi:LOW QUALITY PROTEIN: protein monoglycylase TTLL8 [Meles meles]|uniref:LOW QUALITY PROTEIN: protein monoglycylase TTLL8 n=1 Tax=Meles meles TaxID=9662 RepID=UPI001E69A290|nr:LOW QUALITY PROTEIN: protein monoglycylase TTLL8 [Meles meles]